MDVATIFTWIKALGLSTILVIVAAGLLKYAGLDFLWNVVAWIGGAILSLFQTIVYASPGPVKVLFFLLLFSLLGSIVVPYTIGSKGICDSRGNLWTTGSYLEGASAEMLLSAVGEKGADPVVQSFSIHDAQGTLLTTDGAVVDRADVNGGDPVVVIAADVKASGGLGYRYAVCYNASAPLASACSVHREINALITLGGDDQVTPKDACDVNGETRLARFAYKTSLDSFAPAASVSDLAVDYFQVTSADGLSVCPQTAQSGTQVELSGITTRVGGFLGIGGTDVAVNGWVDGAKAKHILTFKDFSSVNGLDALSLDSYIKRDGSGFEQIPVEGQSTLIQYQCDGINKDVSLYGLPVFDPLVMVVIIMILGFAYFLFR